MKGLTKHQIPKYLSDRNCSKQDRIVKGLGSWRASSTLKNGFRRTTVRLVKLSYFPGLYGIAWYGMIFHCPEMHWYSTSDPEWLATKVRRAPEHFNNQFPKCWNNFLTRVRSLSSSWSTGQLAAQRWQLHLCRPMRAIDKKWLCFYMYLCVWCLYLCSTFPSQWEYLAIRGRLCSRCKGAQMSSFQTRSGQCTEDTVKRIFRQQQCL